MTKDNLPGTEAIRFLEQLRPGGPWVLTAIVPDGPTLTVTATTADDVIKFVQTYDGKQNCYFSVNPTRTVMRKKAAKADIAVIEYVFADLDPTTQETPEQGKARYNKALDALEPPASALIDSGNGIQGLWKLIRPIVLPKTDAPEWKQIVDDVEGHTAGLITKLGGTLGTQNIDRILRLPGTTNVPNKKKRDAGREQCPTKLIRFKNTTCKLEDFPVSKSAVSTTDVNEDRIASGEVILPNLTDSDEVQIDWSKVKEHQGWLKSVADLPNDFSAKGKMIIGHTGNIQDLNTDLKHAKLLEKNYTSWSSVTMALAAIFKADGRYTNEQIAAALMCDLDCNRHVTKFDTKEKHRAVIRALERSYEPLAKRAARALNWRECRVDGMPIPSMHNARLAIAAIGVECSYDTFHNNLLFGYRGDRIKHEMQFLVGEVTDNGIISLRQIMSDRFGFDLLEKPTRDAVISLAVEHCFDPVCDMLAKAEGEWDGIERLDRMAVDYFNCDDTPLNRAIVRKTMIAAVRRARHPGCKFDTITVLESTEGWNKSTAWRVLAGDENFSDVSILGHTAREVQEQLAEVWIHESADLAGMRRAEVEQVKAFASRQVDIARPAYGHIVKKQKRHSIKVGTTNSDEYLQSQTGNRRFWPYTLRIKRLISGSVFVSGYCRRCSSGVSLIYFFGSGVTWQNAD
jgi:hypothetical protein